MPNWSIMNNYLQNLPFSDFQNICSNHNVYLEENDLKIILHIIKNNPYATLNDEYFPIFFVEIAKKTSEKISAIFKPIIENHYLIEDVALAYS